MKINYNYYMVSNRFRELLEEKAKREKRSISLYLAAKELDMPYKNVHAWGNNKVKRFDSVTVERLCHYFACTVGDLLVLDE